MLPAALRMLRRLLAPLGCLLLAPGLVCPRTARCQSAASGPSVSAAVRTSSSLGGNDTGVSFSKSVSLTLPVTNRQAVVLSAEYVQATSFPKAFADELGVEPTWKFYAVPLTVGYQYALSDPGRRLVPVVGVGLSYYFCRARAIAGPDEPFSLNDDAMASPVPHPSVDKHFGMGYGAQATLGLRADLSRSLFVLAQGRARYVNGFALTGGPASSLGTTFTNVDFSLGVGFKF